MNGVVRDAVGRAVALARPEGFPKLEKDPLAVPVWSLEPEENANGLLKLVPVAAGAEAKGLEVACPDANPAFAFGGMKESADGLRFDAESAGLENNVEPLIVLESIGLAASSGTKSESSASAVPCVSSVGPVSGDSKMSPLFLASITGIPFITADSNRS